MSRLGPILCVLLGLLAASAPASAQDAQRAFFRGNDLFEQGELEAATDAWREAIASGADSAELRYNLGTALLRLDRPGEALRELLIARRLAPRDVDVRANLEIARARLATAAPAPPRGVVARALDAVASRVALGEQLAIFAAIWLIVLAFWHLRVLLRWRRGRALLLPSTLLALALGAATLARLNDWGTLPRAVVTHGATAWAGPSETVYGRRFELPEGSVVDVIEERGDWLRIAAGADAEEGWVRAAEVGSLG